MATQLRVGDVLCQERIPLADIPQAATPQEIGACADPAFYVFILGEHGGQLGLGYLAVLHPDNRREIAGITQRWRAWYQSRLGPYGWCDFPSREQAIGAMLDATYGPGGGYAQEE